MGFKEAVEKSPVVWLLGTLVTGFAAGVGAYQGVLEISCSTTILRDRLGQLQQEARDGKKALQDVDDLERRITQLTDQLAERRPEGDRDELAYTHWRYWDTGGNPSWMGLFFLADGGLIAYGPGGLEPRYQHTNVWERDEGRVVFRLNNNFAVYRGEIFDRSTLSGSGSNRFGRSWQWTATKMPGR